MILRLSVLSNDSVHNRLKDVLFGKYALHVLNELIGLIHLIVFKVVNHKI